jgi:hypothetical protein
MRNNEKLVIFERKNTPEAVSVKLELKSKENDCHLEMNFVFVAYLFFEI